MEQGSIPPSLHLLSLTWAQKVSPPQTLLWASPDPKWPKINLVWRMEMSLWPMGESFSAIGFKLHYTSNFMGA